MQPALIRGGDSCFILKAGATEIVSTLAGAVALRVARFLVYGIGCLKAQVDVRSDGIVWDNLLSGRFDTL